MAALALPEGSWTRHGFPRGVRFVPSKLELLSLLSDRIRGHAFPPQFDGVFHDVRILDHHPARLYQAYRDDAENGSIYFFSRQEFRKQKGPAGGGAEGMRCKGKSKSKKKETTQIARPVRGANGGGWKASGGARPLYWRKGKGGRFLAGRMVTLVFYDRVPGTGTGTARFAKSNWGMHEFTVPVEDKLPGIGNKTRFVDLALYRLYILKSGGGKETEEAAAGSSESQANVPEHHAAVDAMAPWLGHCGGILTTNQALAAAAAASTASQQMPPQQLSLEQEQYYQQLLYALAAEAAGDDRQQAHTAPVHGDGFRSHQLQFASPPAPAAPEPPAAADPPAQLPPETATHGEEGQEAGHFEVPTTSPSLAPAAGSPPAHDQTVDCVKPLEAAVPPPLEDAAPAAQDESHQTMATVPADDEFLECVKPLEAAMPPPPPMEDIVPAAQDGIMAVDFSCSAWFDDFSMNNELIMFPLEDFMNIAMMEEPPAMEGDGSSGGGGERSGQAGGGEQLQQEPPAAFA